MSVNSFGSLFKITSFGESHGPAIGVLIDGCPSGVKIDRKIIKNFLEKRAPGRLPWNSSRKEKEDFEILSGVYKKVSLGSPICILVYNTDARSKDYKNLKPRAGHADQVFKDKFKHVDLRGGGRASGRETLSRVLGASIAFMMIKQLHPKIEVSSFISTLGDLHDLPDFKKIKTKKKNQLGFLNKKTDEKAIKLLLEAKKTGESYGGISHIYIKNMPKSLGEPVFKKIKSILGEAYLSIGSVYGCHFGDIRQLKKGSLFHKQSENKHYGGIKGGISTGQDLFFSIYFKPTSSIKKTAQKGRHDPCIMPRALVVLEAMTYLCLADLILFRRLNNI